MDFWKSAVEAAEKAKTVARAMSQKGMELAEATAEEAGKKLKDLGLHDTVGTGTPKPAAPTPQELASYGITPAFADHVRSLNYATFRDFPADQPPAGADPAAGALNPWQLRHAGLVVRAVGEVNELRYVLCPRYMSDARFWAVYFTLVRRHLPEAGAAWAPGDELPPLAGDAAGGAGDEGFMSLAALGGQLRTLSTRLQAAATQSGGPAGLELTSFLPGSGSRGKGDATAAGDAATDAQPGQPGASNSGSGGGAMLESDPELDAFLQAGPAEGAEHGAGDEEGQEGEDGEELDLDEYLNELSAEVGEGGDGGGGGGSGGDEEDAVDVDAALRELAAEEEQQQKAAAADACAK